jgi:type II secretory pathway predicted ATPase ExeA
MELWNDFYHLKENPFGETPDTRFFFKSDQHKKVLSDLAWMFANGKGFACLTGDIGTGKTLLCRMLLNSFQDKANTALVLHPVLNESELLSEILDEFKVPFVSKSQSRTLKTKLDALNEFLLGEAEKSRKSILIIDDAQRLSSEALELIRILSNLETEKRKLLHIILVGQPELQKKLQSKDLRQLGQRISIAPVLLALDEKNTQAYIQHRLEKVNASNFVRFHPKAVQLIYRATQGAPRMINKVCEAALLLCSERKVRLIDASCIREITDVKKSHGSWLGRVWKGLGGTSA